MESSSRIYTSPSLTTHSSNDIADIADRVVHELRTQNDDVFTFSDDEEEEGEFEFPLSTGDDQISLRYPVFDRSLLSVDSPLTESKPPRPSLRQLLTEDRDDTPSDLNGVAPGTYCVWKPNTNTKKELPRGKHKKSISVSIDNNISRRWKVRDLLKRSHNSYNTGKESPVVVFLPPI
ncbi:uncharacterized protein LOC143612347 [Bidens hawaiensis]|uniref:uncharacterized protein LOC143612347 n=1 Tax=Bidens hawaiensis TaxID=980011 RepID=UPI00404A82FF